MTFFTNASFSQPCDLFQAGEAEIITDGGLIQGCSEIKYCMTFANPETLAVEGIEISFTTSSLGGTNFSIPVDLGGFSPVIPPGNLYVKTIDVLAFESVTLWISFRIDEAFNVPEDKYITADVEITYPGCSQSEEFSFDNVIPTEVRIASDPTGTVELDDIATSQPPFFQGVLLIPSLSENNGQSVLIRGTLLVNVAEYWFPHSQIYLDTDAKIVVQNGSTLHLLGEGQTGLVKGCTEMWQSIVVEEGGVLEIDDYRIQEGVAAVEAENGSTVSITNCNFVNNRRGIYVAPGSSKAINFTISDNSFDAPSLKSPFAGQLGLSGIEVNNLKEDLVLKRNQFSNLYDGLVGYSSNIFTTEDTYQDINNAGINVTGNGHILMQVGNGTVNSPNFNRCFTGVRVQNMTVHSSESNVMRNVTNGYLLRSGKGRDVNISSNDIQARRYGISFNGWHPLSGLVVEDNIIEVDGYGEEGTGIFAENFGGPNSDACLIQTNKITLHEARFGIYYRSASGTSILDNEVFFQDAKTYDGIEIEEGSFHSVSCNYVEGTGASDYLDGQSGITIAKSSQIRLTCNTTNETNRGIHILSECNPTVYRGNHFHNHYNALQVGWPQLLGGVTGIQLHQGNRWLEDYPGVGAEHNGNDFEVQFSRLIVDDGDGDDLTTTESTPNATTDFFLTAPGLTYSCPVDPDCPTTPEFSNEISTTDVEIARGNLIRGYFQDAQTWTGKRQLYRRLLKAPSLIVSGTAVDTLFNAESNTTVGKFENVRQAIENLFVLDSTTQVQVVSNRESVKTNLDELLSIENQLDDNPSPSEEDSLLAEKQLRLQANVALDSLFAGMEETVDTNRIIAAAQALAYNDSISVTEDYEVNQKEFNRVYLEVIINDPEKLDSSQTATLQSIAWQCPFAGGEAVYQSRALLDDGMVYNDSLICASYPLPLQKPKLPAQEEVEFQVHPNPGSDWSILELEKEAKEDGEVLIYNFLGNQVYNLDFRKGDQALLLDLSNLPDGTYFIAVRTQSAFSSKLITKLK